MVEQTALPPLQRSKLRKTIERSFAFLLGVLAAIGLVWCVLDGAWVAIFLPLIVGYIALALWNGEEKSTSDYDDPMDRIDHRFDIEWSSVPGNINHDHYVRETQPPP